MAEDIERFATNRPILARPVGPFARAWGWSRRNPIVAISSVTAFLLLAITAIVAVGAYIRETGLRSGIQVALNDRTAALAEAETQRKVAKSKEAEAVSAMRSERIAKEDARRKNLLAERRLEEARRHAYAMALARANSLAERDPDRAVVLLEDETNCPEDLRDFSWHFLRRLCHRDILKHTFAGAHIDSVAFSPDGRFAVYKVRQQGPPLSPGSSESPKAQGDAATAASEGNASATRDLSESLIFFDIVSGNLVDQISRPRGYFGRLVFHPDSRTLLAAHGRSVEFWDIASRRCELDFDAYDESIFSMAVSADGNYLAVAGDAEAVHLWNLNTRKLTSRLVGHQSLVLDLAFSHDSQLLASCSEDKTVRVWETASGHQRVLLEKQEFRPNCVAFSPRGHLLMVGEGEFGYYDEFLAPRMSPGIATIWDISAASPKRIFQKKHLGGVFAAAFSPDGHTVAIGGGDRCVTLRSVADGRAQTTIHHRSDVVETAILDEGMVMSADGCDAVRLWRTHPSAFWASVQIEGDARPEDFLAVSADGEWLITRFPKTGIQLWSLNARDEQPVDLSSLRENIACVAFSPDSESLAVASDDGEVEFLEVASNVKIAGTQLRNSRLTSIAFSPSGSLLAATGDGPDGVASQVFVWSVENERMVLTENLKEVSVAAPRFSPNERFLACQVRGSNGSTSVAWWSLQTGQELGKMTAVGGRKCFAFSPDSATIIVACGGGGGCVHVIDTLSGTKIRTMTPDSLTDGTLAIAPDGRVLAFATEAYTIELWDPLTGQRVRSLKGHKAPVKCIVFSPDGRTLVSGAGMQQLLQHAASEIFLWDPEIGRVRAQIGGHREPVRWASFSPDGQTLITNSNDAINCWGGGLARFRQNSVFVLKGRKLTLSPEPPDHRPLGDLQGIYSGELFPTLGDIPDIDRQRLEEIHKLPALPPDLDRYKGRIDLPKLPQGLDLEKGGIKIPEVHSLPTVPDIPDISPAFDMPKFDIPQPAIPTIPRSQQSDR